MSRAATIAEQERREQRLADELADGWPNLPWPPVPAPRPTAVPHQFNILLSTLYDLMLGAEQVAGQNRSAVRQDIWARTGQPKR
jgi:hypothetical protein